jgi:hypothetical protein
MKAWITKSYGEYVLKYRSRDIEELRRIGAIVRSKLGYDFKDAVY